MPKIDKNIPLPSEEGSNGIIADLRDLSKADIGDSIFFPVPHGVTASKFSGRMSSYISKVGSGWAKQQRRFENQTKDLNPNETIDEDVEGIRVWKKSELPVAPESAPE